MYGLPLRLPSYLRLLIYKSALRVFKIKFVYILSITWLTWSFIFITGLNMWIMYLKERPFFPQKLKRKCQQILIRLSSAKLFHGKSMNLTFKHDSYFSLEYDYIRSTLFEHLNSYEKDLFLFLFHFKEICCDFIFKFR